MSTITITRALVELKTLDKRIQKCVEQATFVSYSGMFHKPHPDASKATQTYQSIIDLLERRKKIKSCIVSSNANTRVNICGNELTVAEAIETKSSIKHYKNLLTVLKRQFADASQRVEQVNQRVRNEMDAKVTHIVKNSDKDDNTNVKEFSRNYMETNSVDLFDKLNTPEKIENVETYIRDFESEVDYVLNEKNATTTINLDNNSESNNQSLMSRLLSSNRTQ